MVLYCTFVLPYPNLTESPRETELYEQSCCQRSSLLLLTLILNGINLVCLSVLSYLSLGSSCQVSLVVLGQVPGTTRCYLAHTISNYYLEPGDGVSLAAFE